AEVSYRSGEVRALGVMSAQKAIGYEEVPTFAEQGRDWSVGGWRGIAVPVETPDDISDRLVAALKNVVSGKTQVAGETFPEALTKMNFDSTSRGPEEFREFVVSYDKSLGELLTSPAMKSVSTSKLNAMFFPYLLMGGLVISVLWMRAFPVGQAEVVEPGEIATADTVAPTARGYTSMVILVLAIVAYCVFAEMIGFILIAIIVLLTLLLWLGCSPWPTIGGTLLFVPIVYQLFSHGFQVALPRGWFGW
ncbi:MAG: tripartite tricarboxylate transporter TctB family protein, partial [Planctomycetales bacterium]|nr:tripartite tricarboxylate transporter TctB family protein [Planctomycetales bacterium]